MLVVTCCKVGVDVVERFEVGMCLPFDAGKEQLMCTSARAAHKLVRLMGKRAGAVATSAVKLGMDVIIGLAGPAFVCLFYLLC